MAVVINEFEVVVEPPPGTAPPAETAPRDGEQPPPGPTPHDIARLLARQDERQARVRAH